MARLLPPDDACIEASVESAQTGARMLYRQTPDGTMHVESRNHIKALKELGFHEAAAGGIARSTGRRCQCGFSSFFRRCSRCGADTTKET